MLDRLRVRLLPVLGLLLAGCWLLPRLAHAQFPEGESKWAGIGVINAINGAMDESQEGDVSEKLVHRFAECSLTYGGLSTRTSNPEAKKSYVQAQLATMEIESTIAKPLQNDKRLELEQDALKSVGVRLRALKVQNDNKEASAFLKSCKSLNDVREINNAVREISRQ